MKLEHFLGNSSAASMVNIFPQVVITKTPIFVLQKLIAYPFHEVRARLSPTRKYRCGILSRIKHYERQRNPYVYRCADMHKQHTYERVETGRTSEIRKS